MTQEALKLALEAMESDLATYHIPPTSKMLEAITAIKEALAQPEQEPVGWFGYDQGASIWFETNKGEDNSVPLYTTPPQPEQEHFALKHRIAELEGAVIGLQAQLAQSEQKDEKGRTMTYWGGMAQPEQETPKGWKPEIWKSVSQTEQDGECKYCTDGCPACDARRQSNVLP